MLSPEQPTQFLTVWYTFLVVFPPRRAFPDPFRLLASPGRGSCQCLLRTHLPPPVLRLWQPLLPSPPHWADPLSGDPGCSIGPLPFSCPHSLSLLKPTLLATFLLGGHTLPDSLNLFNYLFNSYISPLLQNRLHWDVLALRL